MSIQVWVYIVILLCVLQINPLKATYQCGIRKHSFVQLVHHGYNVQEGEWPWHVAMFHKTDDNAPEYACGGTLLDEKHILTAAHCVVNRNTQYPLSAARFELHFGQRNLSKITGHVQIRDVSKVHIHPDFSTHRNDIAVLVLRLPVEYTDFVVPICIDRRVDRDLRDLEGQRGWIAGWGTTESGVLSDELRTASMPVVSYLQCFKDDPILHGNLLNPNVFCAGDRNGTSPGTGDSGGGMYFSEGDRWVLRGIVSFGKADEVKAEVNTSKYAVFVNVQRFLTWIKEIMDDGKSEGIKGPKRISEQECERFKGMVEKRSNGLCSNSRYRHTVYLIDEQGEPLCSGFLVNENHILTAATCTTFNPRFAPVKVQLEASTHDILNITRHPQYREWYYDLAVVKMNTSVSLSNRLVPACLASNWTENLYDTLLQTGFGDEPGGGQGALMFIESDENQVISFEECGRLFNDTSNFPEGIIPGQLCVLNTDSLRRSRDFGSAGGPLQSVNSQTCMSTVVGILLGGLRNTDEIDSPNRIDNVIYTRVAYHLDWIEQIVWNVEPPMMTTTTTRKDESSTTVISTVNNDFVFPDD